MVVAGRLADQPSSMMRQHVAASNLIEYEILATEANGNYQVEGAYNGSKVNSMFLGNLTKLYDTNTVPNRLSSTHKQSRKRSLTSCPKCVKVSMALITWKDFGLIWQSRTCLNELLGAISIHARITRKGRPQRLSLTTRITRPMRDQDMTMRTTIMMMKMKMLTTSKKSLMRLVMTRTLSFVTISSVLFICHSNMSLSHHWRLSLSLGLMTITKRAIWVRLKDTIEDIPST